MTTHQSMPVPDSDQKGFRGSLAGTLVRTLLIFTFIPLALMAGAAYLRTRALLREQVIDQTQSLLNLQLASVDRTLKTKQIRLDRLMRQGDYASTLELALHANPQSSEFRNIRSAVLAGFHSLNVEESGAIFNQFLLMDSDGLIKVASRPEWEGLVLSNTTSFEQVTEADRSITLFGLQPLYPDQLVLATVVDYETPSGSKLGTMVGITESQEIQKTLRTLMDLSPMAEAYFIVPPDQFIASDPYTGEIILIESSPSQKENIVPALNAMMDKDVINPVALEFDAANDIPVLTQVKWLPSMHAGIALQIRQEAIYGQLNTLVPFTIMLVFLTLTAMALVLLIGANRVIKPLRMLTSITREFAAGNWERRAAVSNADEVGMLASSFNQMADELSGLYHSLEQKVDERTRQIRIASEVAQSVTALPSLDDLLNKTVELLVGQLDYYQASIFMVDRAGKFANLRAAYGPAASDLLQSKYKLEIGSASIIGWVSANNQPRVASDVLEDPIHLKNELLPQTRSEASVPISIGSLVLGVLDVQSSQPGVFSPETIVMLQTLASQIAAAIQNVGLVESTQVNFQELARLYRSSRMIVEAQSRHEVLDISGKILKETPYPVLVLEVVNAGFEILTIADSRNIIGPTSEMRRYLDADIAEVNSYLIDGPVIKPANAPETPPILRETVQLMGFDAAAYIPIKCGQDLAALIVLGTKKHTLTSAVVQPYVNLADVISVTLEKIEASKQTQIQLREMEILTNLNQAISSSTDLPNFFAALREQIGQIIGDYVLMVALYDERTDTVSIPFNYEDKKVSTLESFPLGSGLTSIVIRTRQPLMIVKDTEARSVELGAKIIGRPARSWMGVPMLVQNRPIGAMILQDIDHENAFTEDNLRFFTALAGQVASVINYVHLLDESNHRALQLETAAEIARDISGSLNLDELLIKAVNFIRERFDFYHAAIFLLDLSGEFAVVREATGEAGAQFKRSGHKIGVGSKSIVGYVSSRGENLVINDTARDATYYANPLLPDTRAEAAIPLKVGERIHGVLDVQSTTPFAFTEDNLRSLQILADQMAVAVVNSELFAETQEHLSQHRLLHHITTTAASGTTLEEALESAVSGLQVTLGGDRVTILMVDKNHKELEIKASIGYSEDVTNTRVPIGSGITGWVAQHRRPLRVNEVTEDPRYIRISPNSRSELAVPLIYRNELLGVLNVESEQPDAYTENDEEMLGTLGGSLAAIIANARLLEQIRMQAERDRLVYEVTSKIRRSTDIETILTTTASELTKIVGARRTRIQISPVKERLDEKKNGS
jgi:GAF domain-containing protein/HAMP domain-containing protein